MKNIANSFPAILLCSPLIRQYLINYARPLIYTTFLSYPSLAAIRASYTYLQTGKTEIVSFPTPSCKNSGKIKNHLN